MTRKKLLQMSKVCYEVRLKDRGSRNLSFANNEKSQIFSATEIALSNTRSVAAEKPLMDQGCCKNRVR
jgi:hypothetical protein